MDSKTRMRMRAVVASVIGDDPKVQFIRHRIKPKPGSKEALVRVEAASLTHLDIQVLRGEFEALNRTPLVPGVYFSGVIEDIGAHVFDFKKGDQVVGVLPMSTPNGAFAEYTIVTTLLLVRKPQQVSSEIAAAVLAPGISAFTALHYQLQVGMRNRNDNEASLLYFPPPQCATTILPILAAGLGLRVFVATRDPALIDLYVDCFAVYRVIDLRGESMLDVILKETAGLGVQYIFDEFSGQRASLTRRPLLMRLVTSVGKIEEIEGDSERSSSASQAASKLAPSMSDARLAISPAHSRIEVEGYGDNASRRDAKKTDQANENDFMSNRVKDALLLAQRPMDPIPSIPEFVAEAEGITDDERDANCDEKHLESRQSSSQLSDYNAVPSPRKGVGSGEVKKQSVGAGLPSSGAAELNALLQVKEEGSNIQDQRQIQSQKQEQEEQQRQITPEEIAARALAIASNVIRSSMSSQNELSSEDVLSGKQGLLGGWAEEEFGQEEKEEYGESFDDEAKDDLNDPENEFYADNSSESIRVRRIVKEWLDQDAQEQVASAMDGHTQSTAQRFLECHDLALLISCLCVGGRILTCNSLVQLDPPLSRLLMLRSGALMFHFPSTWIVSPTSLGKFTHIVKELMSLLAHRKIETPLIKRYPLEKIRIALKELPSLRTVSPTITVSLDASTSSESSSSSSFLL